jgi:hypothetical protein
MLREKSNRNVSIKCEVEILDRVAWKVGFEKIPE